VSLFTPGRITEPLNGNELDGEQDAVELQIQRVLKDIESLSPEAQLALYQRLLGGLASKLTAAITSKSVTAAQTLDATGAKTPTRRGATARSTRVEVPRAESMLRQLHDPTDPMEAWRRFGGSAAQMLEVLRYEPVGVLERMVNHPNMPPGPKPRGKSAEKLAENISLRLEQYFLG
jgi:hypothetical protein